MLQRPGLLLMAHDPALGRQRALAMSFDRELVATFLQSVRVEALKAAAGPSASLEIDEADRMASIAELVGIDI